MHLNNVLGIIYSNAYDNALPELTNMRTMGSVPFGGRYRLIDFALSSMVNGGISKVGVITKSNYRSLMDHVGTGKPWDLSRKREGMFILPPFFSSESGGMYKGRIDALHNCLSFVSSSDKDYVLLCDCNTVCNMDYEALFESHLEKGADITITYKQGALPRLEDTMVFDMDETGRIKNVAISPETNGSVNFSLNMIIMKKALLERLINEAASLRHESFEGDIIASSVSHLKIFGYEVTGFSSVLDGLQSYYDASMSLLERKICADIFNKDRPVYTKVRDEMPAIYGLSSAVGNSLVADGCKIEGEIENSILFRGVEIARGASVTNSIIMQGSYVGENASLNCVIMDKGGLIKPGKSLCGTKTFPIYVGKGIVI